jgi:hypothetical protein
MNDSGKIVVEIKNRYPVELLDLTQSLYSFAKEYEGYAHTEFEGSDKSGTKLFVKEIRAGSIITELVPHAAGLLPLLSEANTVLGFAKHLKAAIDWLRNPDREKKPVISRNTLTNVSSIVDPVAKDSASQINIHTEIHNHAPVYISVNSQEANAVQNNVRTELELLSAPIVGRHNRVVMYWWQTRNDTSQAGDRVIIESISTRPVKVIFESEKTKLDILRLDENLFKYAFIVDVDVETVENRPALYKVIRVHEEIEKPTTGSLDLQ